jgi:prepilin-type N-terminal cleavage/methylation domain-containing protein
MKTTLGKSQRGMTLLELMMAMSIMTVVMGVLFTLSISIGDTAKLQNVRVQNNDDARRALIAVVPRLRQAQSASINTGDFPGDVLSFRMPADLDGNGTAVDINAELETGDLVTIQRDVDDLNLDGLSNEQLIMIDGDTIAVLANNLAPDTGPVPVPEGEVPPENRAGFWVEQQSGGILMTIRTQGETRRGTLIRQQFTELVDPRN